jgi:hypothetical protein
MKTKLLRRFRRDIEIRQAGVWYKVIGYIDDGEWLSFDRYTKVETQYPDFEAALKHAHYYIRNNMARYIFKENEEMRKKSTEKVKWRLIYPVRL